MAPKIQIGAANHVSHPSKRLAGASKTKGENRKETFKVRPHESEIFHYVIGIIPYLLIKLKPKWKKKIPCFYVFGGVKLFSTLVVLPLASPKLVSLTILPPSAATNFSSIISPPSAAPDFFCMTTPFGSFHKKKKVFRTVNCKRLRAYPSWVLVEYPRCERVEPCRLMAE